jgi:hypothetical protein
MPDKIAATARNDPPDHLRLGKPDERVRDLNVAIEDLAEDASEAGQRLWVSSARRTCSHDLPDRWKVETNNPILEEPDAVDPE